MTNFSQDQKKYDPEFTGFFDAFAFHEVPAANDIGPRTRYMIILAALLGAQGKEEFRVILPAALDNGVTPVEAKEIIYQATAYLGIAKTLPFLDIANNVMLARGISLPLEMQGTTTPQDRRECGTKTQVELFGPRMEDFWQKSDINRFLAGNCFGDYYTRKGLDLRERELMTFCYLAAHGGCDPQLEAHAAVNISQENSPEFLIDAVSQMVPYIGYPRSLNAIAAVNKAAGK